MDEKTIQANAKDLKFYRCTVAIVIAIAVAIGLGVGYFTLNSYEDSFSTEVNFKSKFVLMLMDKEITSVEPIDGKYMTFYREDNPDFDPNTTTDVTQAIRVYYLSEESGEKVYLKDGFYYPNGSVNGGVDNVYVIGGFYYTVLQNLNTFKTVLKVLIYAIGALVLVFLIYLWYRLWCRSEDKRLERIKKEQEFRNSKSKLDD